jgi:hypothetical protein
VTNARAVHVNESFTWKPLEFRSGIFDRVAVLPWRIIRLPRPHHNECASLSDGRNIRSVTAVILGLSW